MDEVEKLKRRIIHLEETLRERDRVIAEQQSRLDCRPPADECKEFKGALFHKKPDGTFHHVMYCLACRQPMTPTATKTHFMCPVCKHSAEFPGQNLEEIIRDLER